MFLRTSAYKTKLRNRPDLTNQRIADRLDIDFTLMSHYANARRAMPLNQAVRVADFLGCDVEDIAEFERYQCTACGCDERSHGVAA